ncbi:TPA: (Fe-S)-binding protein, partial [Staphylococcus aureus]|nr:(Fe-S)-binding protein [Staphylococcus aureus]
RMFMEEKLGTRINEFRAEQAIATGAEEIATGCPFCNVMFTGGVKALSDAPSPNVSDVALMLRSSIADADGTLPQPRPKAFLGTPTRLRAPEKPAAPASP